MPGNERRIVGPVAGQMQGCGWGGRHSGAGRGVPVSQLAGARAGCRVWQAGKRRREQQAGGYRTVVPAHRSAR
eukprot:3289757-Prorocentrum_lima.AAC.1